MNVLIPTDFSDNSWNAINYALHLLKNVEVTFFILHVSNANEYTVLDEATNDLAVTKASKNQTVEDQLSLLKNRILSESKNKKHTYNFGIEYNSFIKTLRVQIVAKQIDLIIMGTKGVSGIKKYLLGSNAGDVITKVKCPVLVIPEKARYETPLQIAFPTDYNISYNKRVLKTLKTITGLHNSSLEIVHVGIKKLPLTTEQKKNKTILSKSIEELQHSFNTCNCLNLEDTIQQFVEKKEINIIAMVAKNLNFFQRILFKPNIEKVSFQTETPFLVLHE
ncbi:universal stress protein [Marixanthomonas sp. SCSIO 43207]|uniref:universal stress protein n=1 Tax=Marixanthomonas sp. SCSIO 43207 TaxID=2779360 RepID=UPI001CA8D8CD|nr:universal stress protein [Marixanthomonas sp. SCSIO 43207]UAB80989.1 universal stress protein [Marixanthomonas sp. SCSIO 43207]